MFWVSFKFPRRGWDQRLADFYRFLSTETRSCYSCLVLYLHGSFEGCYATSGNVPIKLQLDHYFYWVFSRRELALQSFNNSWQKGPNPYFMKTPYITYPLFQILSNLPPSLSSPTPTLTALSVVLFLWLNGWSHHIYCATLFNVMELHMSSLGNLVPEGPWCMFYALRCQVYWSLTHMVFCWYSDLISHTH